MKPGVMDRLDALTGKRRSFIAHGAATTEAPRTEDDDLPILTEIVDINEVSGDQPNSLPRGLSDPLLEAMAAELANAVQQRLSTDFPLLMEDALALLATELRQGIQQITETAIRDFMDRRRQLCLPLDDTSTTPGRP